jgi:radical SAM superfamily enzyme YgiQ (UPF0313 family)
LEEPFSAVICCLNSQYIHSSLAPWCLLAGVKAYCEPGIFAQVTEGTVNEPAEAAAERILSHRPRAVGFCCYIWNIRRVLELTRAVKDRLPGTAIILGGPEVSYRAAEILEDEPQIDFVLSGEGERPFALLLNALNRGSGFDEIPGLCLRKDGGIFAADPYTPCDIPPSPYGEEYFSALNGRIAYLETSRGCPFSCAFCLSGRCGGVRFYPMERAKRELLLLANSGTKTVKLVDRTFNANRERAKELFRFIIENYGTGIPCGVCVHFEIAGDLVDEETLALLAAAPKGAMQLEIGLQSFNNETLGSVSRRTDLDCLRKNIRRLVENGNMHIHIDLIAGLPKEGFSSFGKSFDTAYELKPHMLQLGFLKLLYGAPMREQPEQYPCRFSPDPPYEVSETPWLSADDLLRLHACEDALDRLYNSRRFRRTLQYLLKSTGLRPFELFCRFGEYSAAKGTAGIPLDDYTALIVQYFSGYPSVDIGELRDALVCDRLAVNASGKLPSVLRIPGQDLKMALRQTLGDDAPKRGAALLCTRPVLVHAEGRSKDPVTGEFPLTETPVRL